MSEPNPFDLFPRFCAHLQIVSKEGGVIPLKFNGAQRHLLEEMRIGYARGIRSFIVLKPRQVGSSTYFAGLDLFWPNFFPDVLGALISDTDENRDMFRMTISQYHKSLPNTLKWPIRRHNRYYLQLANGSIIQYLVAGTRKNPNLGQGRAINYAHRTETSSYGDPASLDRSEAAYAEHHPHRLYVDESTAKGYNHYYDMWTQAKHSVSKCPIFISWWMNEANCLSPESSDEIIKAAFNVYRGLDLDTTEKKMVDAVKRLHNYDLSEGQLAWWRFRLNEQYKGSLILFQQEYPSHEAEAFQVTGSEFFSGEKLTIAFKVMSQEPPPKCYKYQFGAALTDIKVFEGRPSYDGVRWREPPGTHLKIWKEPVPGAVYAMGADPAYGSSDWADRFAVCVLRCWADRVEQVAEYDTASCTPEQFAWVLAHLAAYYVAPVINLEIDGPGIAVHQELQNIRNHRDQLSGFTVGTGRALADVMGLIQPYLWRRQDSLAGGLAYHTQSSTKEKNRFMGHLQSSFENDRLALHSEPLLDEMKGIVREGDDIKGAKGRAKDDRVIALALAHVAWFDKFKSQLRDRRIFWQPGTEAEEWATLTKKATDANMKLPAQSQLAVAGFLRADLQRALK
jgi:hypothetical protein